MAITYELVKSVTEQLYDRALKRIPEDTKEALRHAKAHETSPVAQQTLQLMLASAERAEKTQTFVCSDAGVPTYTVKIGTGAKWEGNIKAAISDGFDELVKKIQPPLLKHVTNPLTLERGYKGKDMPLVTWEMIGDANYIEIICAPKALGSGRWADMEVFSFPTLEDIERYVMKVVIQAGSQHCPPVVVGVGIGGDIDTATKMAKQATLRPFGTVNAEPILADMEKRLTRAINATGFGPMGTGGDTTALAVHCDYASGHGYTPIAVAFNCWINRRTRARIANSGDVTYLE